MIGMKKREREEQRERERGREGGEEGREGGRERERLLLLIWKLLFFQIFAGIKFWNSIAFWFYFQLTQLG